MKPLVIPAKVGIQSDVELGTGAVWIPAFAGMTEGVRLAR
jgi:hypothetical protein